MKILDSYINKTALIIVLLAVLYINYLTVSQSRNVIFMDDWGTPGELFYSYFNGGIDTSDFLSQHNESRLVLTKIYSIMLVKLDLYS